MDTNTDRRSDDGGAPGGKASEAVNRVSIKSRGTRHQGTDLIKHLHFIQMNRRQSTSAKNHPLSSSFGSEMGHVTRSTLIGS